LKTIISSVLLTARYDLTKPNAPAPAPTITTRSVALICRSTRTAQYLKSGSFDIGSTRLFVRLLALFRSESKTSHQCIGRKTTPCLIHERTRAFTLTLPLKEVTLTRQPSSIPSESASTG